MTLPLPSQHVVCPVAGSGQHHPLRGPRSRTRPTRNDASVLIFEAGGERRLPDAGRTSSETRTWRRRVVLAFRLEAIPSLSCRPSRLSGRGTPVPAADGERAEAHGGPPGGTVRKSRLTTARRRPGLEAELHARHDAVIVVARHQ